MSKKFYKRSELIDGLFHTFQLYQHRFSKENTKRYVDRYIDRVIPDSYTVFFTKVHLNNINAKICYFMDHRNKDRYDQVMCELQEVTFFIHTFKTWMWEDEIEYIQEDEVLNLFVNFKLDAFSLKMNVDERIKKIKLYDEEEIYESRSRRSA